MRLSRGRRWPWTPPPARHGDQGLVCTGTGGRGAWREGWALTMPRREESKATSQRRRSSAALRTTGREAEARMRWGGGRRSGHFGGKEEIGTVWGSFWREVGVRCLFAPVLSRFFSFLGRIGLGWAWSTCSAKWAVAVEHICSLITLPGGIIGMSGHQGKHMAAVALHLALLLPLHFKFQ
jgi:hypothetical protein